MSLPAKVILPSESFVRLAPRPNANPCALAHRACSGKLARISTGDMLCEYHRRRLGEVLRAAFHRRQRAEKLARELVA